MRLLSILDLTPIEAGSSSRQALMMSGDLAALADRLGYHRLWFAEHHNAAGLASAAPEVMIAHVANRTTHLRLGSGGVMLPNHAPLKIAETFRLLEALHPGRIDLGLGRAPGGDTRATLALRRTRDAMGGDDYPERLAELLAFDDGSFPDGHPLRPMRAMPVDVGLPPLWLLGSSDFSAQLAAETGLGFAFAAHIHAAGAVRALRAYREHFIPSARYPAPRAILAVSVTVGESAAHAQELARVSDLILLRLRTGRLDTYPTAEEARAHQFTSDERALLATIPMSHLAGDPDAVRRQINDLADRSQADEVMISTRLPGRADRERTIRSLARVFGLQERPVPVTGAEHGAG